MTIYINETTEDITFCLRSEDKIIRIEKPCEMKDAKHQIRKVWNLVGTSVTWKNY